MILTDYYKAESLTASKCRYDITRSSNSYDFFERTLINKRTFNVGGLSLNIVQRPNQWQGNKTDLAITKGTQNITSIKRPGIENEFAYGDINGTNDACLIIFNSNYKEVGIMAIEIFIARGLKNDISGLWQMFISGELSHEIEALKSNSVTKNVTAINDDNAA